jgi:hypothetical protein
MTRLEKIMQLARAPRTPAPRAATIPFQGMLDNAANEDDNESEAAADVLANMTDN